MEKNQNTMNLQEIIRAYIGFGWRRKWWIIFPLVFFSLGSFVLYEYLPKVYRSTIIIGVQPQTVPESIVQPMNTATIYERLNTINQEIRSRPILERIIIEFDLYSNLRRQVPMEEVVERMRPTIQVDMVRGQQLQARSRRDQSQHTFSISYEGRDPRTVQGVTNRLASFFIEENMKEREIRAERTSDFIGNELGRVEQQLNNKEKEISKFKQRHIGQLPGQLEANLRTLERLQQQLKATNEALRAAEDRGIVIQTQMDQLKKPESSAIVEAQGQAEENLRPGAAQVVSRPPESPIISQYNLLKRDLEIAQSKYRENHPDVIDLKRKISNLEPAAKEMIAKQEAAEAEQLRDREQRIARQVSSTPQRNINPGIDAETQRLLNRYTEQFTASVLEAKRMREEESKIKKQIQDYHERIEETPKREQELSLLMRDYELLKNNYKILLDKKIQSEMSENLERKQQGEKFRIIEPARMPEKPIKPDFNKIIGMGALVGLIVGFGLAWFVENWNKKFYAEGEVEKALGIPVIAVIPNLKEDKAA